MSLDDATEQEWNDAALAQNYPEGVVFGLLPKYYQYWLKKCYDGHCAIQYFDGVDWQDINHDGLRGGWAYRKKPWNERDYEIQRIKSEIDKLNKRLMEYNIL